MKDYYVTATYTCRVAINAASPEEARSRVRAELREKDEEDGYEKDWVLGAVEEVDERFEAIKAAILQVAHAELGPDVADLGDLNFWTPEQWDNERGEPYGRGALLTATFEGPVYALMNTGTSFPDKLCAALATLGVWYDLGFAWSLHVYAKP